MHMLTYPLTRNPTAPYFSLHVSGMLYLKAGQGVHLAAFSSNVPSWFVQAESNFVVVGLKDELTGHEGFAADMSSTMSVTKTGWTQVQNYQTPPSTLFNLNQGMF